MRRPIIGITLDREEPGGYANTVPWYALRTNYMDSIAKAGGVPIALPPQETFAESHAEMIDGLVVTGGYFDVPPAYYGEQEIHPTVNLKLERSAFEKKITELCFQHKKPILGICGGMQLINVIFGGSLTQDIPSLLKDALCHKQKPPYHKGHHSIELKDGTFLENLTSHKTLDVNSVHHQCIKEVGPSLKAGAIAPDGIVEAIEHPHQYCLGVQWHPEYDVCELDQAIFTSFIQACQK